MKQFEDILICPISHQPLRRLSPEALVVLNERITQQGIVQRNGAAITQPVSSALKAQHADIYYLIQAGIYILLADMALVSPEWVVHEEDDTLKKSIQEFYNTFGWTAQAGVYQDAIDSEDLRPVSQPYIEACHHKLNQHLQKAGQFLLDIASGPVQYDAYLSYGKHFQTRICADMSYTALRRAKERLQDKGVYLLCDITRIPIESHQIDAIVSLHTIYHVPQQEQMKAFEELHRTLKPGGQCVVVYSWGQHCALMKVLGFPYRVVRQCVRFFQPKAAPDLYFYTYPYRWYQEELQKRFTISLYSWRSLNVPMMKKLIHPYLGGKFWLALLFRLEQRFPKWMGRMGAYPYFVIEKAQ